ncbi:PhzF family phenazine biosynthesis protein [Luethyella okanaganae]|uniref:PhzF family phenazine biosynthesis protein n=1 Tax=Luethyella okanaganae TaxID=69372 RepID=A0ABW1VCC3_9MICO
MKQHKSTTTRYDSRVLRYAAFTDRPDGGNPAGVVLDASGADGDQMLQIAQAVGYSETAFLTVRSGTPSDYDVRYFSPEAEVPFCGHATIASAVALAELDGTGELTFHTAAGTVPVSTHTDSTGRITASLRSVTPRVEPVSAGDLDEALAALGWRHTELDQKLPPRFASAGARHLIIAARTRGRLAELDYDFERLKAFMLERDLTTIDLVWREHDLLYHARNPFPVGGVYEDPATGAAAAAFGAYLRELDLVRPPVTVAIHQGDDMGRPSKILVDITANHRAITVSGTAIAISDPD